MSEGHRQQAPSSVVPNTLSDIPQCLVQFRSSFGRVQSVPQDDIARQDASQLAGTAAAGVQSNIQFPRNSMPESTNTISKALAWILRFTVCTIRCLAHLPPGIKCSNDELKLL